MNPLLKQNIKQLIKEADEIYPQRTKDLQGLAQDMATLIEEKGMAKVTFVCTHNSRRSQLAELWLRAACAYYKVDQVEAYSGGTEATAFNPRMVDAAIRFGFEILREKTEANPRYIARLGGGDRNEVTMFSKKYSNAFNPSRDFIAVMVCSQADKECPFVPGAFVRVSLPYEDPKAFDDTPDEIRAYDDKVKEVGREILYVIQQLTNVQ